MQNKKQKVILPIFIASALSLQIARAEVNEPDFKKEERFHNIYKKYNEQPTAVEVWDKAVGDRKSQTYSVQKGDTLWSVSNTFFGDPNYWPKIWSLNSDEIENPHIITPGMVVRFYPGSIENAPTLGLDGDSEDSSEQTSPVKKRTPVLKNIPNSLPLYRYGSVYKGDPKIDALPERNKFNRPSEMLGYFVENHPPASAGTIVETELGMNTATEFQNVIVKLFDTSSKEFLAFDTQDKIQDPLNPKKSAVIVEVQGIVQIKELVNAKENLYRATVKKILQPVHVGAKLMASAIPTYVPSGGSPMSAAPSVIIGGQFDGKRFQFSPDMIVYLNAGTIHGYSEGQVLQIFSNVRARNEKSKSIQNDRAVGILKIVKVSESYSTAVVLSASDDIAVGDHVGASTVLGTFNPSRVEDLDTSSLDKPELESEFESAIAPAKDETGSDDSLSPEPELSPEPSVGDDGAGDLTL